MKYSRVRSLKSESGLQRKCSRFIHCDFRSVALVKAVPFFVGTNKKLLIQMYHPNISESHHNLGFLCNYYGHYSEVIG